MTDSIRAIANRLSLDAEQWERFFAEKVKKRHRLVEGYIAFVNEMASKGLPPIFEGAHLAKLLSLSAVEFARLTSQPEKHYRTFSIPKRGGGSRSITVPSPLLLRCQRWIDWFILRKLPVHSAAHGYVAGKSNITNAEVHCGASGLICVDILNFFGSIQQGQVTQLFFDVGYPPNVAYLLSQICCFSGSLPQGGASSPSLSNIVMLRLDSGLEKWASSRSLKYSRYVDDITVSGKDLSLLDISVIRSIINNSGYEVNNKKTRLQLGQKKVVTGISIGSGKLRLPREMRRRFKNEAFHMLKALGGKLEDREPADPIASDRVLGKVAYWRSVEAGSPRIESLLANLQALNKKGFSAESSEK